MRGGTEIGIAALGEIACTRKRRIVDREKNRAAVVFLPDLLQRVNDPIELGRRAAFGIVELAAIDVVGIKVRRYRRGERLQMRSDYLPRRQQPRCVYYLPRPAPAADLELMRQIDRLHLEFPFAGRRMLRRLLAAKGSKAGPASHQDADAAHGDRGALPASTHDKAGAGASRSRSALNAVRFCLFASFIRLIRSLQHATKSGPEASCMMAITFARMSSLLSGSTSG